MADTDLIERATKAIDLFDAICNIHDPSVSAHDRRIRAMAKVLEAAPSPSPAPGVVVEALNSFAIYTVYTVEDEDDWVYLSAGGVQIARVEAFTKRGIALLKLNASVQAALASLSQPAKGEREGGAGR